MYLNFKNYVVEYDELKNVFSCSYLSQGQGGVRKFIKDAVPSILSYKGGKFTPADYKKREFKTNGKIDSCVLSVLYSDGPEAAPLFELHFTINLDSLHIRTFARAFVRIDGPLLWGEDMETSTFAMRLTAEDQKLRAACGPAVSLHDNALFDRLTDSALEFKVPAKFTVDYDWSERNYRFAYESGLDFGREFSFKIHEDLYKRKFNIPYAPIQKTHGFATPPVGWMTWYAVQFKASEQAVIENAKALSENFGKYSDKLVIWVDWEWNHNAFNGLGEEGVDTFTPRKAAYPHGLGKVSKEVETLGLIPALWIGATNDGQQNELLKKHPDWLLAHKADWCGQFWIDPSNPEVLDQYIPAVFKRILDWGYKMVKWDCFPSTFKMCDSFHDKFRNPALTTDAALREVVKAARKTLGPDVYLLSCSGESDRDIGFAIDLFDAGRIGGDIFGWEDFIANSIDRVFRYYPWHNTAFYADADNLILRSEFSTPAQARSRVSFYGLAGLPVTIGDSFKDLDAQRLSMLSRIIPVADIHPMDLQRKEKGDSCILVNLAVCKKFGNWNVVGAMNTKDSPLDLCLSLEADLHISTRKGQRYAVYDFWNKKFLGVYEDALQLSIPPMDTAVLRITELGGQPQILSTSRHITQGAIDLKDVQWNEQERRLSGVSELVAGEPCEIAVFVPAGFTCKGHEIKEDILTLTLRSEKGGDTSWQLVF